MESNKKSPKPQIVPTPNGPYFLLDDPTPRPVGSLQNSRGEGYSRARYVALCRCGGSKSKPFCDGTHLTNNFSDKKEPDRQPDRRDNYVGKKITIHDNRGICAHSGFCTDGLSSVFKLGAEPWVDPDAAQVEAIIETIKKCPSGALSYSIDGVEYRDQDREPMITVTKDGPHAITGGIELVGQTWGEEASTEHYSLCRCGGSKNKPFCSGRHWDIGFKDDAEGGSYRWPHRG